MCLLWGMCGLLGLAQIRSGSNKLCLQWGQSSLRGTVTGTVLDLINLSTVLLVPHTLQPCETWGKPCGSGESG